MSKRFKRDEATQYHITWEKKWENSRTFVIILDSNLPLIESLISSSIPTHIHEHKF